ncbi:MAG TPA: BMP family ABC transporter substrate-binding protein [Anaerolineales bacterium]|nr:BMP family ABC transporter substrate-binding protein [Anaerolineales bacterium]
MKKSLLFVMSLLVVASMVLTACAPAATATQATTAQFTCALITPNPLGDRSFIDASARGIERANAELPVKCDIIESSGVAENETALRGAIAQDYDLILGLAMDPEMFLGLVEEFPDQKFASPSEIFLETLPENLIAYQIDVHESSFLVGLIVGSLTQTKTVGAVVGGDNPALNQFYYGYKQGVLEVCPDCEVLVSYLGFDFSNPTLGLETALGQYDQGADIIYQVAGRSGEGVLEAAAQRDLYAIGVDSNQDDIQPGHVIVSMLKKVEATTYDAIKLVVDGKFTGGFHRLGMKEGAAGLSWDEGSTTFEEQGPPELTAKIPEIKALVEEYRTKILNGELKVCDAFLPETPECVAVISQ